MDAWIGIGLISGGLFMTNRFFTSFCCSTKILIPLLFLFLIFPALSYSDETTQPVPVQSDNGEMFFSRSELISSSNSVIEGQTIVFTIIIRYDGPEESMKTDLSFPLPDPALFVSASPEMAFLENDRELRWQGDITAAHDMVFTIELVTLPDSADAGILRTDTNIYWRGDSSGPYWQGGNHWIGSETKIHSKQSPVLFITSKGTEIGKVEVITLTYLTGGLLMALCIPWIIRRREKRRPGLQPDKVEGDWMAGIFLYALSFTLVVLIGIAHLMGSIALQDFRRLYSFEQTSCTLLDKRITTYRVDPTSGKNRTQSKSTDFNKPLVAVSYTSAGEDQIISSGPPKPTSMNSPLEKYALRELAKFNKGETYPCWYDPRDPTSFVLIRGLSWGWYLIGIGPLILLFFLGRNLIRRIRG